MSVPVYHTTTKVVQAVGIPGLVTVTSHPPAVTVTSTVKEEVRVAVQKESEPGILSVIMAVFGSVFGLLGLAALAGLIPSGMPQRQPSDG